ncbi:hypothetical protein GCM10008014_35650 [Paenibacillus silvae]|uniref:Glycosyltransferase family 1 protein n=1 Tax=Paenibacillus silvae TaxID=1325358 RepID=A0ABQ1ZGS9_9BACL|nr:DUF6271 family protein [Paenibacillus silvae]GGH60779.1 hypothetical protein GCM10008014_35650 [Paenibacillus silvae]
MKSVYFIPSNRNIERCLTSYMKEIDFAQKKYGIHIPIVVPETNDKQFVAQNARTINLLQEKYPKIEILHLTTKLQEAYFDILLAGEDPEFKKVFLAQHTDYGNCMNKLFLMTCSLGADALHRRDSDTRLIFDELKAEELYPIELELNYLGKRISDCSNITINTADKSILNREIWVVGGNYYGEWNLDVRDFARVSFDPIYRLYELLGFPKESVVDICNTAFQLDQQFTQGEKQTLVTSVNDGLNPDCGNVAVYKLHEKLPNLPGRNTAAADYFAFDTATALGIPSIHHTREVFHEYKKDEFQLANKMKYWEGVSKFADYFNAYMSIYDSDLNKTFGDDRKEVITNDIVQAIQSYVSEFSKLGVHERVERIDRIANEVLIPFDEKYSQVGDYIIEHSEQLVREANQEYEFHVKLIENWDRLIQRAKEIDLRKVADSNSVANT